MKKAIFILSLTFIFSCGNEETKVTDKPVTEENLKKTDLSEYELPFVIQTEKIKDENGSFLNIDVTHEDGELDWILKLGNSFNLVIEDWGDEKLNPKEEVKRQQELEQHFDYNYIKEESNYVVYSKSIPGDTLNTQHYFYSITEVEEGYYYAIKSNPSESFTLKQINSMLEASLSLTNSKNTVLQ